MTFPMLAKSLATFGRDLRALLPLRSSTARPDTAEPPDSQQPKHPRGNHHAAD